MIVTAPAENASGTPVSRFRCLPLIFFCFSDANLSLVAVNKTIAGWWENVSERLPQERLQLCDGVSEGAVREFTGRFR